MVLSEKKSPRTTDTKGTARTHNPLSEGIVKGKSKEDIALLKAAVEPDVEKGLSQAKKALAEGANVNAKDNIYSVSALMLASSKGRMEIVELLVNGGADVNAKDDEGLTALWYARRANHMEVAAFLQEHGAKA